ncbi:MAG: N-acetyltransferase [Rhodobacteraceae bacterium]|nr:N-acetyltransferase [Paracoccaceae bacterium]
MADIRHARLEDASAIAAVWNPLIRDTLATFNSVERTGAAVAAMLAARAEAGHPWLVADAAGNVVGFASYAQFRPGPGYALTMEHTIILDATATGRGVGARLMDQLVAEARARGAHSLIGAISAENPGALAFHSRHGFVEVGRIPEAGAKFGRLLDLVLVQRRL